MAQGLTFVSVMTVARCGERMLKSVSGLGFRVPGFGFRVLVKIDLHPNLNQP